MKWSSNLTATYWTCFHIGTVGEAAVLPWLDESKIDQILYCCSVTTPIWQFRK